MWHVQDPTGRVKFFPDSFPLISGQASLQPTTVMAVANQVLFDPQTRVSCLLLCLANQVSHAAEGRVERADACRLDLRGM